VLVRHLAPHTSSLQKFKAVVGTGERASFDGKIYIEKEAQKTEAYQMSQALLLTPDAKAFSKPGLEIFADDVKASHGATIGQIDLEELFYLQSRGLSREEAKQQLIEGFAQEIRHEVP
jgi:Fe-S cluster assembly protein SufD